jgi:hypothetical protein
MYVGAKVVVKMAGEIIQDSLCRDLYLFKIAAAAAKEVISPL